MANSRNSLARYAAALAERRAARRSRWHLLKPILIAPVMMSLLLGSVYLVRLGYVALHGVQIAGNMSWSGQAALVAGAIAVSFIPTLVILNILLWLIPPARAAFEAEAHQSNGVLPTFREANAQLTTLAIWSIFAGGALLIFAAFDPVAG